MMDYQKFEKWLADTNIIQSQVLRLMDYRRWNYVYEQIINANPSLKPGTPVLDYFRNIYGDYAAMSVRRQAKPHRDAVSLAGLLADIVKCGQLFTRTWMRKHYASTPTPGGTLYPEEQAHFLADSTFKQFASADGETLDVTLVERDIADLNGAAAPVVDFTDKRIAHYDRTKREFEVSFDQLDIAIELIAKLTKRYILLITGAAMQSLTPIDLTNSLGVFKFPWIDPGHAPKFERDLG